MSWQGQMGTMLRYLINDTDPSNYRFQDQRIETTLLVAAQLTAAEMDFANKYTINVESCLLSPDPTKAPKDDIFMNLVTMRAACIFLASEIRSESGNAISIKDGPSAIDLRGVSQTLVVLYQDLCKKYEKLVLQYRSNDSPGQSVLSPFSPGSDYVSRGYTMGDFF